MYLFIFAVLMTELRAHAYQANAVPLDPGPFALDCFSDGVLS
jgi:hypothetical protein